MEADGGDGAGTTSEPPTPPAEGVERGDGVGEGEEAPLLFGALLLKDEEQYPAAEAAAAPQGTGDAVAASSDSPAVVATVLFGKSRLRCSLCSGALKSPIYQCAAGHLACCRCRVKLPDSGCRTCRDASGAVTAYAHCPALDLFFRDLRVPCIFEPYGCKRVVPYSSSRGGGGRADGHAGACDHAPCFCPEPGCGFLCAPRALAAHLADEHASAWPPVDEVAYSTPRLFLVPVPHRRLLRGDDASVFLLAAAPLGGGAAVSLVLVRANAPAHPRFTCTFINAYPPDAVRLEGGCYFATFPVRSTALADGDGVAPEKGVYFFVPGEMMYEGEAASRELLVSVRIDRSSGPEPQLVDTSITDR
ncbi:hypothetical protein EJB05_31833 [Eragrostis curvula]|uniref:RING-type E3 ubiquitin transferase n=1 Tax=Eragrostis curvula TaxID=38414 RepID=A0A5J9UFW4_9POAL|nr:hypothetical protein EJB05_31833 [Eragrostis curvula]